MMDLCLWCYFKGDPDVFHVNIPPDRFIDDLKIQIFDRGSSGSFVGRDPKDLILTKIDEVAEHVKVGQYRPTADDPVLDGYSRIFKEWPDPLPDKRVQVFVSLPDYPSGEVSKHIAAESLYQAVWQKDIEVDTCEGLKYLSRTKVGELQLGKLGCGTKTILFREEYDFALKELMKFRPRTGGISVMGQPGIGKSIFLYYLLLRLLSMGEPVALQRRDYFYLFSQHGVQIHSGNSEWNFQFEGKLWALSDSRLGSEIPCASFISLSEQNQAFIVQATSPAEGRWKQWQKECNGTLFVMSCFTENEAKALSIISGFDVKSFLADFKMWGPSARTCVKLADRSLSRKRLQDQVYEAANTFARNPTAITMQAPSQEFSNVLFCVNPIDDDDRSLYTSSVATPYLCSIVQEEIAQLDAAAQALFYHQVSTVPRQFRRAWGYMFAAYFLVWLYSTRADELVCVPKSTRPAPSTSAMVTRSSNRINYADDDEDDEDDEDDKDYEDDDDEDDEDYEDDEDNKAELRLQPLGREKVTVISGDSNFGKAKESDIPFCWIPASRTFPSFDAVICTDEYIITIQLTVSPKHTMKDKGFRQLKKNLPPKFESARTWCYVLITDREENAITLRKQNYKVAKKRKILIYSTVLNVPACKFSRKDVKRTFRHIGESVAMDTSE